MSAEASSAHRAHHRRAPGAVGPAHHEHALAVVHAQDEASLDHVGEDGHALGRAEHPRRNRLDLEAAKLIERLLGELHRLQLLDPGRHLGLSKNRTSHDEAGSHGDDGQPHGGILSQCSG
jgi:hypothetical protein